MTYNVFGGTLNLALSIYLTFVAAFIFFQLYLDPTIHTSFFRSLLEMYSSVALFCPLSTVHRWWSGMAVAKYVGPG